MYTKISKFILIYEISLFIVLSTGVNKKVIMRCLINFALLEKWSMFVFLNYCYV